MSLEVRGGGGMCVWGGGRGCTRNLNISETNDLVTSTTGTVQLYMRQTHLLASSSSSIMAP